MSEEDQTVDVTVLPKFDMPSYESEMTSKDVKSLALRHGIPLDLHPVALTKGWTMDQLPDDMIGLYEQYFEFSGIRVPFSTFLLAVIKHFRVHISQLVPLGLNRLTMFELYCRSLGIVPSVNLFRVFYKVSKQGHWFSFERRVGKGARGQVFRETFSGLKGWKKRFFFLDRRAIPDAMVWRHHESNVNDPVLEDGFQASYVLLLTEQIGQHTARPLPTDQPIPEKTAHQKEVEVEDPKIFAARERKARAAAKKRERGNIKVVIVERSLALQLRERKQVRAEMALALLRLLLLLSLLGPSIPTNHLLPLPKLLSRERIGDGRAGTLQLETFSRAITYVDTEVVQPTPSPRNTFHSSETTQPVSPLRATQQGNVEAGKSSRRSSLYVPDWSIPQRSRMLLTTPQPLNGLGLLWREELWPRMTFLKGLRPSRLTLMSLPRATQSVGIGPGNLCRL
ncbi:hypothetical protein Tco_0146329, partial [Tanacetum coccineum]